MIADDEEVDFPVHRNVSPFLPGDSLLLCSDGVHDCLGDSVLKHLFTPGRPPIEQVAIWRQAILDAGAPDNLSLIMAYCPID